MLPPFIRRVLARCGWELRRRSPEERYADLEPEFIALYERCAPATMTSIERMYALYQAVRHVHAAEAPGDVVECGVWRGGSSMLAALALESLGDRERCIWLYDTFEGMPPPAGVDRTLSGEHAADLMKRADAAGEHTRAAAAVGEVRANLAGTGFPADR